MIAVVTFFRGANQRMFWWLNYKGGSAVRGIHEHETAPPTNLQEVGPVLGSPKIIIMMSLGLLTVEIPFHSITDGETGQPCVCSMMN